MEEIHDAVPEHLKCPICFEIPKDKVFQCRNGHIFCDDCYEKLTEKPCPHCSLNLEKDAIRCRAVEEMLASLRLEFPCQFQSSGCNKILDMKNAEEHTLSCKYDLERFGQLKNVCHLFGFQNCSFKFNRGDMPEALLHFQQVHQMLSLKAQLSIPFQIDYKNFEDVYNSPEEKVFTPLIFDQRFWGHNFIYLIVTRFNPNDKTLQFIPFYLIDGRPKKEFPPKIEFTLGYLRSSSGTLPPQDLLECDGETLSDSSYFAVPLKKMFSDSENPPPTFCSTVKIEMDSSQLPENNFEKGDMLNAYTTYSPADVLTPFLLNRHWPLIIRKVLSAARPQDWNQFGWIAFQDFKHCAHRFHIASPITEMKVLICRANINGNWLIGVVQMEDKNANFTAHFKSPFLLKPKETFHLKENFEVLYTPPGSFGWVPWIILEGTEPLPVHEEDKDLLICESRIAPHSNFIGAVRKDTKLGDNDSIYVLVLSSNGKEIVKRDNQGNIII